MLHEIKALLAARGILEMAPLALADCRITKPYLLERVGISDGTAYLFAVPYYTTECDNPARNISAYAVSADYHRFFDALFAEILPILRAKFPENRFAGFTDHSPIAEVEAAVRSGLGFYGCNHLFMTERHSSYVFIGEIITDAPTDARASEGKACPSCGACQRACPVSGEMGACLSALTQKKGELSPDEQQTLLGHGLVWGCDICQEACPITKQARASGTLYSTIPYFRETAIPHLTAELVAAMSDEEFAARAYSWRGRAVILRNLMLTERRKPE